MAARPTARAARLALALVVAVVGVLVVATLSLRVGGDPGALPTPAPTTRAPASPAPDPVLASPSPAADGVATDLGPALAPLLGSPALGPHVGAAVLDLASGQLRYGLRAGEGFAPASTLKVLTCLAALEALGPEHRFATRTLLDPATATVALVGGGDPVLATGPASPAEPPDTVAGPGAPTRLADLATATAEAVRAAGLPAVSLVVDESLIAGPAVNPLWEPGYVPAVADPVAALPPGAGQRFADLLAAAGVPVAGLTAGRAPAAARPAGVVRSVPLDQVVEHVLTTSDNDDAELLARAVALARGLPVTFAGGASGVVQVLAGLGLDLTGATVLDGSGLARGSRVTPDQLVSALAVAADADRPRLRAVLTGLPVAGFTGSLADRFDTAGADPGRGLVRAKTGTLTGVSGLAGVVTTADGANLAWALLADQLAGSALDARAALDAAAAAIAGGQPPVGP